MNPPSFLNLHIKLNDMATLFIVDNTTRDPLVRYSYEDETYVPIRPFYMCSVCFETIRRGYTPVRQLVGSLSPDHRCMIHPHGTMLHSSSNPNLAKIPWTRIPSLFDDDDEDW